MRKRNLKKTILAAALAVPVAFSYPGWAVRAQEDEKVSTETEAQEVMQDNTAPEEAKWMGQKQIVQKQAVQKPTGMFQKRRNFFRVDRLQMRMENFCLLWRKWKLQERIPCFFKMVWKCLKMAAQMT